MNLANQSVIPDPWRALRSLTDARVAIGRTGGSLPTAEVLDFRLAHARARDAVHAPFDAPALTAELAALGVEAIPLTSAAADRAEYLRNPDSGRRLSAESRSAVISLAESSPAPDLVIIVSDGLSALAAHRQAGAVIFSLLEYLKAANWIAAPVLLVRHARVALQDEIGALLHARLSLILLGERPGLGSPDSLGAYFTWQPRPGRTDAERNCVSNIRPAGLPPAAAAHRIFALLTESRRLAMSGVDLKDHTAEDDATPLTIAEMLILQDVKWGLRGVD